MAICWRIFPAFKSIMTVAKEWSESRFAEKIHSVRSYWLTDKRLPNTNPCRGHRCLLIRPKSSALKSSRGRRPFCMDLMLSAAPSISSRRKAAPSPLKPKFSPEWTILQTAKALAQTSQEPKTDGVIVWAWRMRTATTSGLPWAMFLTLNLAPWVSTVSWRIALMRISLLALRWSTSILISCPAIRIRNTRAFLLMFRSGSVTK